MDSMNIQFYTELHKQNRMMRIFDLRLRRLARRLDRLGIDLKSGALRRVSPTRPGGLKLER